MCRKCLWKELCELRKKSHYGFVEDMKGAGAAVATLAREQANQLHARSSAPVDHEIAIPMVMV